MTIDQRLQEILKLNKNERIFLAGEIWDSIVAETNEKDFALSEGKYELLKKRSELLHQGQTKTYTWEEVRSYIRSNY